MKHLCLLLVSILMLGCASTPTKMIFAPTKAYEMATIYNGQQYQINVTDNRRAKHLLKVIADDDKTNYLPAANAVDTQLLDNFSSGLIAQGLNKVNYGTAVIDLSIIQLEAVVAQHPLKYDASFAAEFKVTVSRNGRTFFKTFTGHSTREGPLRFDVSRMEQDLNQLVKELLGDIFNDQYIVQSIRD